MPRRSILTAAEKESLVAIPESEEELIRYWLFLNKQGKSPMVLRNSLISDF